MLVLQIQLLVNSNKAAMMTFYMYNEPCVWSNEQKMEGLCEEENENVEKREGGRQRH